MKITCYDFDKTVFDGDSTAKFIMFCIRRKKALLWHLLPTAIAFFAYLIGLKTKTEFKERMYRFLKKIEDIDEYIESFWETHQKNLKDWYMEKDHSRDVIISASPDFLLRPICEKIGVLYLISSQVSKHDGTYTGENCYGEEKVRRLQQIEELKGYEMEEFYSDSLSDAPLAMLADTAYIVQGDTLIPWDEYKPSKVKEALRSFLSGNFILFLLIGAINTVSTVLFSAGYELFIQPNVAFVLGYTTSLLLSYVLNSKLNFKVKMSIVGLFKFAVSYIPNFIIQNIVVIVFMNWLGFGSAISYAIAGILGIPITFLFMRFFAFAKK